MRVLDFMIEMAALMTLTGIVLFVLALMLSPGIFWLIMAWIAGHGGH